MKKPLVEEWIERGKQDLNVAKILLSKKKYFDLVLFHIHQAVEKHIKGFLIHKGWKLKKVHDLEELIKETINYDESFKDFLDFGRILTAFYFESRYPPGPPSPYSKKEIKEILKNAERLIKKIEWFLNN
jgi:HEPN domain-containing protein